MSVCLSVYLFFLHNILKTTAARIAELDTEMLHHESWKHFCFDVKRSKVTRHKKTVLAWVFALLLRVSAFSNCM